MSQKITKSLMDGELSVRSYNCLTHGGIETLEQIAQRTERELLSIPGLGVRCLNEIRKLLKKSGVEWAAMAAEEEDGMDKDQEVTGFRLKKVKSLPLTVQEQAARRNSMQQRIISRFLDSGLSLVRVDLEFSDGDNLTNGDFERACGRLRSAIRNSNAPIQLTQRQGDIYLIRLSEQPETDDNDLPLDTDEEHAEMPLN